MASDPQRLTVSIAMGTYNGAAYLQPQLDSIARQTRVPDELVISDDQSTDETLAIVRRFAETAPFPVRWQVNERPLGYRRNFIETGARCQGAIIFFSDQDDVWHASKIAKMVELFGDEDVLFAYHNAMVTDPDGAPLFVLQDPVSQHRAVDPRDPNPFHFTQGLTQAYRRELHRFDDLWSLSVDRNSPSGEPFAHDQWYFFIGAILGRIGYASECLVDYRQHGGNVSGSRTEDRRSRLRRGLEFVLFGPQWNDLMLSREAASRSEIALRVSERLPAEEQDRVRAFADRYAALARWLQNRHASANESSMGRRLGAVASNLRSGAYRGGNKWRLMPTWMLGDAIRAVTARPGA